MTRFFNIFAFPKQIYLESADLICSTMKKYFVLNEIRNSNGCLRYISNNVLLLIIQFKHGMNHVTYVKLLAS